MRYGPKSLDFFPILLSKDTAEHQAVWYDFFYKKNSNYTELNQFLNSIELILHSSRTQITPNFAVQFLSDLAVGIQLLNISASLQRAEQTAFESFVKVLKDLARFSEC